MKTDKLNIRDILTSLVFIYKLKFTFQSAYVQCFAALMMYLVTPVASPRIICESVTF